TGPARPATDRALATMLFTDIVGSTDLNASMGDTRWSALLDRHDRIMRDVIGAWKGRFVKSTGDGVLAVFETPVRAVRAALAARNELGPLGIRIRASAHVSEVETRGDDVAGLGVTIAARLLGEAEPGQVLVTENVRDLSEGSGVDFVSRGAQMLKGVPGTWIAYAVAVPEPQVEAPAGVDAERERRRASNLPQLADAFLGRHDDLQRVATAIG